MFPIPWNRLFRKKDGTLVNIEEAMSGGGGGGSTVEITPVLTEGTKIADFEIDGEEGSLFAPSGGGGGGSLSYKDITKSCNLVTDKWTANYFDVSDLSDKTIVGCVIKTNSSNSDYMASLTSITPNSSDEIPIKIFSSSSSSPVNLTVRIFYY